MLLLDNFCLCLETSILPFLPGQALVPAGITAATCTLGGLATILDVFKSHSVPFSATPARLMIVFSMHFILFFNIFY